MENYQNRFSLKVWHYLLNVSTNLRLLKRSLLISKLYTNQFTLSALTDSHRFKLRLHTRFSRHGILCKQVYVNLTCPFVKFILTSLHWIFSATGVQSHSQTSQPSLFFLKPYIQNIRHVYNGQRLHEHSSQPAGSRSKPYWHCKAQFIGAQIGLASFLATSSLHEHIWQPWWKIFHYSKHLVSIFNLLTAIIFPVTICTCLRAF